MKETRPDRIRANNINKLKKEFPEATIMEIASMYACESDSVEKYLKDDTDQILQYVAYRFVQKRLLKGRKKDV